MKNLPCCTALTTSYFVFGLRLYSNVPLPGVTPSNSPKESPEIRAYLGMRPHPAEEDGRGQEELIYTNADSGQPHNMGLCIWRVVEKGLLRIAYPDGTQFWLDDRRETLWATWPETLSLEETCTYLFGPILGFLLRLRGTTCLHASAVNIEGRAVAFVGAAGTGKSTTAAAFARRGFSVLSDDIVPLMERDDLFLVLPAYSHLCLWPDSVKMLYGSADALPRVNPNWEKRRLVLGERDTRFENHALPLGAIYILGNRRAISAPRVEQLCLRPALLSLVADTYANKTLDRDRRAQEFALLGRLVARTPVRRVFPHSNASRLYDLCTAVEADFAVLKNSTRAYS